MSMLLHKPYLVKWSTKGEGGQKSPKKLSTWFMDAPLYGVADPILIRLHVRQWLDSSSAIRGVEICKKRKNKAEHVQTYKPRVNAVILISHYKTLKNSVFKSYMQMVPVDRREGVKFYIFIATG